MKRNWITLFAAICIGAVASVTAGADFVRSALYTDGMFSDVPQTEWYAESVKDAYEFGIMKGDSTSTFRPEGTLTLAEGITVAARICETLSGAPIDLSGEHNNWYTPYVNYLIEKGVRTNESFVLPYGGKFTEPQTPDYDRNIMRYEMAILLSSVSGDLPLINQVSSLPDIPHSTPYKHHIFKLYNAGILTGNDEKGTFSPTSYLTRAEISAMAVRIADSSKRVKKIFPSDVSLVLGDAYSIIQAVSPTGRNGLANGWNYDNRFDLFNTTGIDKTVLNDASDEKFYRLIRDFKGESEGLLRFELLIDACGSDNGIYIAFQDKNENNLFEMTPRNGKWAFIGTSEAFSGMAIAKDAPSSYAIEMDIDLTSHTADVVINNTLCGEIAIPDGEICRLVIGTNKVGTGTVNFKYARLLKNYAVTDRFLTVNDNLGQTPVNWQIDGDFTLEQIASMRSSYDLVSVHAALKQGEKATASRQFSPIGGKVAFETLILLPEKTDGAFVDLMSNGDRAVTFQTANGKLYVGTDGFALHEVNDYIPNVWQTLRVEADTTSGFADIYVNGKKKVQIPIHAASFDRVQVQFAPTTDAEMWFDDVEVYNLIEHDDYPAYPQVSPSDGYNIGVNVCWLWRDSHSGEGWDSVSAFEEFEPYLGYYDEGLRETADWELKWMAEHGIDFLHACWYCPVGSVSAPIKEMRVSHSALHDGYMLAKYSDLVDFCIMWENSAQDCTSFEQFKEYIWNYWVEYYFRDERYARLDNKAVLTIWNTSNFERAFGGAEGTRKAVAFMNEELKKLGYDGLILLASTQGANSGGTYHTLANLGYDATYGYHWGTRGYDPEHQISANQTNVQNSSGISHHIPTVSVGFNDVGRNETRDPMITAADHLKVCEDIKRTLAQMDTGTWKDNTLMVSTWNEYSEGTYVLPTNSNGFTYLENIRAVFTTDMSDHSALDVRPTKAQIDRVTHLYPENHSPIRWLQFEMSEAQKKTEQNIESLVASVTYDMSTGDGKAAFDRGHGLTTFAKDGSVLSGSSDVSDYAVQSASTFKTMKAADVPIVHIRMKNDVKANFEIFFLTSTDSKWDEKKYKPTAITKTGEFVDYYVNMASVSKWVDDITAIRIDPQTAPGSFEIALVEFMNTPAVDSKDIPAVCVNGNALSFTFAPQELPDKDLAVVGEARQKGFYSSLRLYHEWDRFTDDGVLTLKTFDDKTLVFTVGSDMVLVDGRLQPAGFVFTLRDGLPVFHIKKLCDLIGYPYTMDGKTVSIQAASAEEFEILASRVPNEWEFSLYGELEGWNGQQSNLEAKDGCLVIKPTGSDVAVIHNVSFSANQYTHIAFGIEYGEFLRGQTPQLFFTTSASSNYTADKCINGIYELDGKKPGDIVEVRFDLTTSNVFSGTITGIRIDPYSGTTPSNIDYIRCRYDENAVKRGSDLVEVDDGNQWYFDGSDVEGWNFQNSENGKAQGGYLYADATNGDPAILHAVDFDADEYRYCVVGVRYKKSLDTATPDFFFTTAESPSWAADKSVRSRYIIPEFTNVGDTVEVTFDLAQNPLWCGSITGIRFDMFTVVEDYEIDYVRFYKSAADNK